MTETQTVNAESSVNEAQETPKMTDEEKAKIWEALPDAFKTAVSEINRLIEDHNKKIDAIKASEAKDVKALKAEIREQNPSGNKAIARINEQITKLNEQIEKLVSQADKIIEENDLMPRERSEEELAQMREEVKESSKLLKDKANGLSMVESLSNLEGKLAIHVEDIKTLRGVAKSSTSGGSGQTGIRRLRFKEIYVNGVQEIDGDTVYKEVKNAKTGQMEKKSTFSNLAAFLTGRARDINVTAGELQKLYFDSLPEGYSPEKLPADHTFQFVHTYKTNNGNEESVTFDIRAIQ